MATNDRFEGVIQKYNKDRGFGYIKAASSNLPFWFHYTFLEGGEESELYERLNQPQEDEFNLRVTFLVRQESGGTRLQAISIKPFEVSDANSEIRPIAAFLRSPKSNLSGAQNEFLSLTKLKNIPDIDDDRDLRMLVISRITRNTRIWERISNIARLWVSVTEIIKAKRNDEESKKIIELLFNELSSTLYLPVISAPEYIGSISAISVRISTFISPVRWLRQAQEAQLTIFLNSLSLRQAYQKDTTLIQSVTGTIKLIFLLDEDDPSTFSNFSFAKTYIALIDQRQILEALFEKNEDYSFVLGRLLRSFLPNHLIQPYEVGSEYNRSVFSGRENLRNQILDSLDSNYAIYGGRKIGKSWFLKDLCFHCSDPQYSQMYAPIYVSVQGTNSLDETADLLVEKLIQKFNLEESEAKEPLLRLQNTILKANKTTGKTILIALDEIDDILKMKESYDFFARLRRVWQNYPGTVKYVFAGFKELLRAFYEEADNFPIANWFGRNHLPLSCLDKEDVKKLIIDPMKWVGIEFDEEKIVEKVFNLTAGHPYYTQSLCQAIVNECLRTKKYTLDEQMVSQQATIDFFAEVFDIFEGNLSNLQKLIGKVCESQDSVYLESEIRQSLLERFDLLISEKDLREELRVLVSCSVLIRTHSGGYRPLLPLINQEYFKQKDDTALAIECLEEKK